ncbi:MAG: 4-hydroxybenzoate octaprenyltransferase [Longimicrobiales bacterium]
MTSSGGTDDRGRTHAGSSSGAHDGASSGGCEGQTFGGGSLLSRYASFVKLPHTLFALPFAGVGVVLASYAHPDRVTWRAALWIVIAFTAARFAAMGFNRIADRRLDAENPRTRMRELPSGRLTVHQAWLSVLLASALFIFAAAQLNPLCARLAPLALGWVFFYSYTKRLTTWAHHVLGLSLGIAPVGAYVGISGVWPEPWFSLPVVAAAVMFWVAGFDVIYSLQDIDFDRRRGLHSVAARYGPGTALGLARVFHAVAVLLFLAVRVLGLFPVGLLYTVGVILMALLLVYENHVARSAVGDTMDLRRIDRAFFRVNIAVSMLLFTLTLLDRVVAEMALT